MKRFVKFVLFLPRLTIQKVMIREFHKNCLKWSTKRHIWSANRNSQIANWNPGLYILTGENLTYMHTKSFSSHPFTIASFPLASFCLSLFSFVVFCNFFSCIVFIISTLIISTFYCLNYTLLLLHLFITHPVIDLYIYIYLTKY